MASRVDTIPGRVARGVHAGALVQGLVRTEGGAALLVLRLAVAAVLFPHGAQKVLGWFGGHGLEGTLGFMTGIGIPGWLATIAIFTEFAAPIALALGLGGRVAAAGVMALMVGAGRLHLENGFFMNWSGSLPAGGEGFEYHILLFAMAAAVAIAGSGAWSVDRHLARDEERSAA